MSSGHRASPQAKRRCPICGKPAHPQSDPFCSPRCANIDLHRWLSGTYAVPAVEGDATPDDPAEDPPDVSQINGPGRHSDEG